MLDEKFKYELTGMRGKLYNFAMMLTCNDDIAYHLLQDTIVEAIDTRNCEDAKTDMRKWLFRIMRNIFITRYRRNDENVVSHVDDVKPDAEKQNATLNISAIEKGINYMSDMQKRTFGMFARGYKANEIAAKLNLSIVTVESNLYNASRRLELYLDDCG